MTTAECSPQAKSRSASRFFREIHDPDVEVVGILPREISTPTALVGFVSTKSKSPAAAKALLKYLSGPEAAEVYKDIGMKAGR